MDVLHFFTFQAGCGFQIVILKVSEKTLEGEAKEIKSLSP
jgi:hypothetical protein